MLTHSGLHRKEKRVEIHSLLTSLGPLRLLWRVLVLGADLGEVAGLRLLHWTWPPLHQPSPSQMAFLTTLPSTPVISSITPPLPLPLPAPLLTCLRRQAWKHGAGPIVNPVTTGLTRSLLKETHLESNWKPSKRNPLVLTWPWNALVTPPTKAPTTL